MNTSTAGGVTLPMVMTVLRLGLSPVFVIVFHLSTPYSLWLSVFVAAAIELSDLIDGAVARRWNQVTDLGKLLDPLADSISRLTIYACFASRDLVPIWVFLILMYRDSAVALTRTLCAYRGKVLSARISGKIKAWFQATGEIIVLVSCVATGSWEPRSAYVAVGIIVAAATFWSGVDYVWTQRKAFRTSPLSR